MKNKKYELLQDDTIQINGATLYRIKALKNFSNVCKGDIGGYIEKEKIYRMKVIAGCMMMLKYMIMV